MKNKSFILTVILLSLLASSASFSLLFSENKPGLGGKNAWLEKETTIIGNKAPNLDKKILRLGLKAYLNAQKKGTTQKGLLTVIDYSKPSSEKRLWVFDVNKNKVLFNTWVAHGSNSGDVSARSFSNKNGTHKSSFGVFLTDISPYMGGHGISLRMRGLEKGINDNAYNRNIVFHGAQYVNGNVAKQYGRVGRSWGCPAVDQHLIKPLISSIKNKTLVFAYYPDRSWLNHSQFLTG